jgi:hypothetical protein
MLHKEILTSKQKALLPLVNKFAHDFGLVGGTAIALHLGHRRSIDFDLFSSKSFNNLAIQRKILRHHKISRVVVSTQGELTLMVKDIRLTFFEYPFKINYTVKVYENIKMPDLLTLAAMKAYALGKRSKWKDYVDLCFVMRKYHGIKAVAGKARLIFGQEFNERLFRTQLSYFNDVNYSEKVTYLPGTSMSDNTVKRTLTKFSLML